MNERLDGCAQFDERLLEAAFAPSVDARLDRHLAQCERCARARDRYLRTADALAGALAMPAGATGMPADATGMVSSGNDGSLASRTRRERARTTPGCATALAQPRMNRPLVVGARRRRTLVALAAIVLAIAVIASVELVTRGPQCDVTAIGTSVRLERPTGDRVVLHEGAARFEIARGVSIIETPLGALRADDAELTVNVEREEEVVGAFVKSKTAWITVTVAVTAGVVWWSSIDAPTDKDLRVEAGHVLTRSTEHSAALEAPAGRNDALSATDASAAQASSERSPTEGDAVAARAPISALLRGRILEGGPKTPIADAEIDFAGLDRDGRLFEAHGRSLADGTFALALVEGRAEHVAELGSKAKQPRLHVRHPTHVSVNIALGRVDPRAGIDVGDLNLARGVRVSGRVVDALQRPVANAVLFLNPDLKFADAFPSAHAEDVGRTDEHGNMIVGEELPHTSQHSGAMLMAVSNRAFGWLSIAALEGRTTLDGLELCIGPQAALRVRVEDEQGQPIEGAEVHVEPRFEPLEAFVYEHAHDIDFGNDPRIRSIFFARTDTAGTAVLPQLPVSPLKFGRDMGFTLYDVVAKHDGYRVAFKEHVRVSEAEAGAATLVLPVRRALEIAGHVRDEQRGPIAAARIKLSSGETTVSDELGAFRFAGIDVSQPSLELSARADGFADADVALLSKTGETLANLEVVLLRPLPIEGRVVDQLGQPVRGASLLLGRNGKVLLALHSANPKQPATDGDGRFSITNAGPGRWDYWVDTPEPRDQWKVEHPVGSVQAGERNLTIVLERREGTFARLEADVVDANSGKPLDSAAAMLIAKSDEHGDSPGGLIRLVRVSGHIFQERVAEGDWRLWVLVTGRVPAHADFRVERGQALVRTHVEVGDTGSVRGRIVFGDIEPEATLNLFGTLRSEYQAPGGGEWEAVGNMWVNADVDADGTFHFDKLVPAHWTFRVDGERILGHGSVDIRAGAEATLEIVAEHAGRLRFTGKEARTGGLVQIEVRSADDLRLQVTMNAEAAGGTFMREEALRPGRYRYTAWYGPLASGERAVADAPVLTGEVLVEPGKTASYELPSLPERK